MRAIALSLLGLWLCGCDDHSLGAAPVPPDAQPGSLQEAGGELVPALEAGSDSSSARRDAGRDAAVVSYPKRDAGLVLPDASAAFADADLFGEAPPLSALPKSPDDAQYKALEQKLKQARALDAAGVTAAYPSNLRSGVSYDARNAQFMERIQASALALDEAELGKLGEHGFVISTRREFPTFVRGFAEIYAEHLPLFVSADALLDTVHRGYDAILRGIEEQFLRNDLSALLHGMHARLADARGYAPAVLSGVDLYLCVAIGLLDGAAPPPVQGADPMQVAELLAQALAAQGPFTFRFFGVPRFEDFSQFRPRGHYERGVMMQSYFRAQMWLGRVDLRLIETENGGPVFRREQFEAMLLMEELIGPNRAQLNRIDGVVRTFVGASDSLNPAGARQLIDELGGSTAAKSASDQAVTRAIRDGGYGAQQIASHLAFVGSDGAPDPLNRSFLLLGQRYVVDSHVFSSVVFDRIPEKRMMPSPLDAAFAALGNSQALALMPDLTRFPSLPGALAAMRTMVDAHDAPFWSQSLYNQWLGALRALSPGSDAAAREHLPELARSEAWGRRILNTQLGSWAQLRHDTLLYAKQSYTGIPVCEYPDAYVDPYPAFYRALNDYALAGQRLTERLPFQGVGDQPPAIPRYFAALAQATSILRDMAERELRGEPFTAQQMAFINDAVRIDREAAGCASIDTPNGWLADLFLDRLESIEVDLPIADVHTQPADEAGSLVGRVLHAGTGFPRFMVTTIDTCMGPRAYAGVVFAYHEEVAENFKRYTDSEWQARFVRMPGERPAELPWLAPVQAR